MMSIFRLEGWLLVIGAVFLASAFVLLWAWTGWQGGAGLSRGQGLTVKAVVITGSLLVLVHAALLRDIVMAVGVLLALGLALGVIRSRS
jgi:hypothetical protein